MIERVTVLHVSDLHICEDRIIDAKLIIDAFLQDISRYESPIDLVCFSGDMIERGDKANEQYQLALEHFVMPLLARLGISTDRFFTVPGNHDVDRSAISPVIETGLHQRLINEAAVNEFLESRDVTLASDRLQAYYQFEGLLHTDAASKAGSLHRTYSVTLQGSEIGVACLNSAWRSSGDGDRGHLIIGDRQILDAYRSIEHCDFKIAMYHHPTSALTEFDEISAATLLSKFNLVLNGHTHTVDDRKVAAHGQETVFNMTGSLYPGRDRANSYSIIEYDMVEMLVTVHNRSFSQRSREFEEADTEELVLHSAPGSEIALRIVRGLNDAFPEIARSQLVPSMLGATNAARDLFAAPNLRTYREYEKEAPSAQDGEVQLSDILDQNSNVAIIGQRETGKTAILNRLTTMMLRQFHIRRRVPFIVNADKLKGREQHSVVRQMIDFALRASEYVIRINQQDVMGLLEARSCYLMFDNVKPGDNEQSNVIRKFVQQYPGNTFVIAVEEDLFRGFTEEQLPQLGCEVTSVFIHSFERKHIRDLVERWLEDQVVDTRQLVNDIYRRLTFLSLPRTPLMVSMTLAVIDEIATGPVNESRVLDRFMSRVLGGQSGFAVKRGMYGPPLRELFLCSFAWHLTQQDTDQLLWLDFEKYARDFMTSKNLSLEDSGFLRLFLDKNILVRDDDYVYFRYRSIFEFAVAKYALSHNEAMAGLLANPAKYAGELAYVTGLVLDRSDIEAAVRKSLVPHLRDGMTYLEALDDLSLLEFQLNVEQIRGEFQKASPDEQWASSGGSGDPATEFSNQRVTRPSTEAAAEFGALWRLYGLVIRNSEGLDGEAKTRGLRLFVLAGCIAWGMLRSRIDEVLAQMDPAELEGSLQDENGMPAPQGIGQAMLETTGRLLQTFTPLAIQNVMSETIGTQLLGPTIVQWLSQEQIAMLSFMITFLYADMGVEGRFEIVERFVTHVKDKHLLSLSMWKLTYYVATGSRDEPERERLLNLLAECRVRVDGLPRAAKGKIIEDLRRSDTLGRLLNDEGI